MDQKMAIWKQRILDAYDSGISLRKWLDSNSISSTTFHRWKREVIASGDISPDISPRSERKKQERVDLWKKRIDEARRSGLDPHQWCIQEGISWNAFRYWEKLIFGCSDAEAKKWKEIILNVYKSKLSIRDWCGINNINITSFYKWKRILIKNNVIPADLCWRKRKQERDIEFWLQIILKACSSELTIAEWCKQNNVEFYTFLRWKKKLIRNNKTLINVFEKHETQIKNALINSQKGLWKQRVLEAYDNTISVISWCEQNSIPLYHLMKWRKYLLKTGEISPSKLLDQKRLQQKTLWLSRIRNAYDSGLTRGEWCRKNHIAYTTFEGWEKRFIRSGEISTDMVTARRQEKKNRWKKLVLDYYNSNMKISEWCKQNNISYKYFYEWKLSLERSGDIPTNLSSIRKQRIREKVQHEQEEWLSEKYESITPVFCELQIPENAGLNEEDSTYVSKGTAFQVGKFSLVVKEDVSEDMLNATLEALKTVMEVFSND